VLAAQQLARRCATERCCQCASTIEERKRITSGRGVALIGPKCRGRVPQIIATL
jgi:hypothetical protein